MSKSIRDIENETRVVLRDKKNIPILSVETKDVQIGTSETPSDLTLMGRFSYHAKTITCDDSSATETVELSDDEVYVVLDIVQATVTTVNCYLPLTPRTGQLLIVRAKDSISDQIAVTSTVYLKTTTASGNTINGLTSYELDDSKTAVLIWSGTQWNIITQSIGDTDWIIGDDKIRTTSSVAIGGTDFAESVYAGTIFYVSGTKGIHGALAKRAVFDGDVHVSGSLAIGTGTIVITSNYVQWGAATTRIEKNGSDLKLFDINNAAGATLSQLVNSNLFLNATYASLPAIGATGKRFFPSDGFVEYIDDGALWRPNLNGTLGFKPPAAASLTNVNVAGSVADYNGTIKFIKPGAAAAEIAMCVKSVTGSNFNVETVHLIQHTNATAVATDYQPYAGCCMRESGTDLAVAWMLGHSTSTSTNSTLLVFQSWTDATTIAYSIGRWLQGGSTFFKPLFLRLRFDGTWVYAEISHNRYTWQTIITEDVTVLFSTQPDQCGMVTYAAPAALTTTAYFLHYFEG